MPKKVKVMPVAETRTGSKRAASKIAMQQLAKLSQSLVFEEPETLEILSDDDVIPVDPPTKKKYRVSHRKSSDGNERDVIVLKSIGWGEQTLNLEVWPEELSAAQLAYKKKAVQESDDMNKKLQAMLKNSASEVVFEGDSLQAYEVEAVAPSMFVPPPIQTTQTKGGKAGMPSMVTLATNYSLVLDPRSGAVVGTVTPTGAAAPSTAPAAPTPPSVSAMNTRKRNRSATHSPAPPAKAAKVTQPSTIGPPPLVSIRPTEATSVGGLSTGVAAKPAPAPIVDLTTSDERPTADSREVSFNKLQGKTFPSLVVVARPHIRVVASIAQAERVKLDAVVKGVLMHPPTKFTEWLIQKGLVKSEQWCSTHLNTKLKLGMYSDVSKFPFSGGYVWISECCPHRFVSVFSGSIFEGSPHAPSLLLKLIYHWCCQTNVQNVVQWVKVDNLFLKGFNTWLRAACTVALQAHDKKMGGFGVKVEIGVISLGTTSQDGNQRQVKVEVLGILETTSKRLRLRAVEPLADVDRNYKKRFSKILEPLLLWVHMDSLIVTDLTVDKATLLSMGFNNVVQNTSSESSGNQLIMDYLRRIVPRMFQNTLSLLSRQIIQQFLDELVWREWFGTNASEAFDNIISHISEQTKLETNSMISRYNRVALNPFKNWLGSNAISNASNNNNKVVDAPKRIGRTPRNKALNKVVATPAPIVVEAKQQLKAMVADVPDQLVPLEHYYYGTINSEPEEHHKVDFDVRCHACKEQFTNNIDFMKHYFTHVNTGLAGGEERGFQCVYCLKGMESKQLLEEHINSVHPTETRHTSNEYVCILCESKHQSIYALGKHMSHQHVPSELPFTCGSCSFRCSSHKEAVNHFHRAHNGHGVVQCPFCLKSTVICTSARVFGTNLHYFLQHLHKHQRKNVAKKCQKCMLWFVHKDGCKEHLKMHDSQRKKAGLIPWVVPRHGVMVPKSIKDTASDDDDEIDISNLKWNVPNGSECKECHTKISTSSHYPSLLTCSNENCQYVTCCILAMTKHTTECKTFKSNYPKLPLPFEMHCVCGFSDTDGNSMANHLSVCERHSAYPSKDAAKSATVTHSMLDVLGLVRRPEELPPTANVTSAVVSDEEPAAQNDKNEKTEDSDANDDIISDNIINDDIINETVDEIKNDESNDNTVKDIDKVEENNTKTVTAEDDKMEETSSSTKMDEEIGTEQVVDAINAKINLETEDTNEKVVNEAMDEVIAQNSEGISKNNDDANIEMNDKEVPEDNHINNSNDEESADLNTLEQLKLNPNELIMNNEKDDNLDKIHKDVEGILKEIVENNTEHNQIAMEH